ncbi:MAG: hypothetical protein KME31_17075 [Tolypothrix carrinoi HA7290-LM1]|jgi:hypothetical protein|nr:hypothetical protein [Tolypothrix carrinoi HA7290-LM1]
MKNSIPVVWFSDVRELNIKVDSPEWFSWLESIPTFSYQSADGKFTARKQGNYWNVYRKSFGKLRQEYLATTENLTLDRMQETAKLLNLSDLHYWTIKAERKKERVKSYKETSITSSQKPTSYIDISITDTFLANEAGKVDAIKETLKEWEVKVQESCSRSGGKPSERYRYVSQMLQDLQSELNGSV